MLVEINLLPKKDKKPFLIIILTIILLCTVMLGALLFGLKYHEVKQEYTNVRQSLSSTKKLYALEEKSAQNPSTPSNAKLLEDAVKWAESDQIPTVFMMKQLTALLPERGFFMSFKYQDDGNITLNAQFDTNREVAFYLNHLTDSKFIKDVSLNEVSTVGLQNNGQSNLESNGESTVQRYNAVFTIQLNTTALKQAAEEEEEEEEK